MSSSSALVARESIGASSGRYTVEVDRLDAAAWSAELDRFDDANLYQTWAFGEVCWGARNCSRLVLKLDGEVVALAQVRIIRPTRLKFGLAQVRWGPVCHPRNGDLDPEVLGCMALALRDEFVVRRGMSLRVLPYAFQGTPRCAALEEAFAGFKSEPFIRGESYRTIRLDLTPPLDLLRKQLDQKWRNQLNRAEKNNLVVVEGSGLEDFRAFVPLFDEMNRRKQLESTGSIHNYESVQSLLPPAHRFLVLRAELDSVPVAGLVGAAIGSTGVYVLGATTDTGMQAKGSYLLQWRMIQWLKERGLRTYDLGGINPVTNPGVYHFKKGFSGEDVLFMHGRVACENFASAVFTKLAQRARGRLRATVTRLLKRG
jgi:FemAB family